MRAATREKPDLTLFVPGWLPVIYATGTGGHTYANIFAGFRDLVRARGNGASASAPPALARRNRGPDGAPLDLDRCASAGSLPHALGGAPTPNAAPYLSSMKWCAADPCEETSLSGAPILRVAHDGDDGTWQFLCGPRKIRLTLALSASAGCMHMMPASGTLRICRSDTL